MPLKLRCHRHLKEKIMSKSLVKYEQILKKCNKKIFFSFSITFIQNSSLFGHFYFILKPFAFAFFQFSSFFSIFSGEFLSGLCNRLLGAALQGQLIRLSLTRRLKTVTNMYYHFNNLIKKILSTKHTIGENLVVLHC